MNLYLIRHGEAENASTEKGRPLSTKGSEQVASSALKIKNMDDNISIPYIYHSSKLRARQTAEIIGNVLNLSNNVTETQNLLPEDDPAIWASDIKSFNEDVMLVGHLPYLGILASILTGEDVYITSNYFTTAGMICLESPNGKFSENPDNKWNILWFVRP